MINKTIYQGRLTRDPEINTTASGIEVCNFTLAWSKKYKENERKCFLDCTAWRQTAAFINKYFKKGSELAVEGELETDSYTDKDGNKRSRIRLTVTEVHFCGKKADSDEVRLPSPAEFHAEQQPPVEFEELNGDNEQLPF